jgi:hypothetical protein
MPPGVTCINHFNFDDYALNDERWPFNQSLKPSPTYSYLSPDGNLNDAATRRFRRQRLGEWNATVLNIPADRHEIFAYAASSAGHALGKMGGTGGVFSGSLDVTPLFRDDGKKAEEHKYHSGQFRSTIQKRWGYWNQMLTDLLIPHNQP